MNLVDDVLTLVFILIAVGIIIAATVAAVLAFIRGESIWSILKIWLKRLDDAISGIG